MKGGESDYKFLDLQLRSALDFFCLLHDGSIIPIYEPVTSKKITFPVDAKIVVSLVSIHVIIVNEYILNCPLSHKCFWDATTGYLIYDHKLSY